jgi:serine O-acetyltransferase
MRKAFIDSLFQAHQATSPMPPPTMVFGWLEGLLRLLFPELSDTRYPSARTLEQHFNALNLELYNILEILEPRLSAPAKTIEDHFLDELPALRDQLLLDARAIQEGDPAAFNTAEVIRTYPGFLAIAVYRIAHVFFRQGVPLIPRILTEYAHAKTGVDIHPGASIGARFCIDHATGIVIGETVSIGSDVKIYQGVTLGALSVKKELAMTKRHPTIGDRVVIYSGATILGGQTVIGHDSVIGGNVWLTESVPPFSRIYYDALTIQKTGNHPPSST